MAGSPEDRYPDLPDGRRAPLRPSDVNPINDGDLAYILDGDGLGGGGHRAGTGLVHKREFPARWDDGNVREAIEASLWSGDVPRNISLGRDGVTLRSIYDNVVLEIPISDYEKYWEVATAYPLSGDGVCRNVSPGRREPVPLNLDDFTRRLDS